MTADYSDLLISTFPNINDQPVAPTASKAGNGAHLVKSFNDLINRLDTPSSSNWLEISNAYTAKNKERLFSINSFAENTNVVLSENPPVGFSFTALNGIEGSSLYMNRITKLFGVDIGDVYISMPYIAVEFFYVSDEYGWACTNKQALNIVNFSNS